MADQNLIADSDYSNLMMHCIGPGTGDSDAIAKDYSKVLRERVVAMVEHPKETHCR